MSDGPGLLELLHPDGRAERAGVLGAACPERLRPPRVAAEPPWDLVVLAPSSREARASGWGHAAAGVIGRALGPAGIVYLLGSPGVRRRLLDALRQAGLTEAGSMLHLPAVETSELLIRLRPALGRGPRHRVLALAHRHGLLRTLLSVPGSSHGLARWHRSVGVIVRRPGGREPAAWLAGRAAGAGSSIAGIATRWRADAGRVVLHLDDDPGIVKSVVQCRDPASGERARNEARALAGLAAGARAAGAGVPTGRLLERPGAPALALGLLPGTPADRVLARHPERYESVLRQLADWLGAWHRGTCRPRPLERDLLERWVLGPATRMAGELDGATRYTAWLDARCRALLGQPVPLVATHNDLTMANVLLDEDHGLGILDWEAAQPEGLPLTDYYYALVDATAARRRYADRVGAFERCFGGRAGNGFAAALEQRLRDAAGVSEPVALLAFHACWLHHAENERRKRPPGEPRPFLEYLRRAAAMATR